MYPYDISYINTSSKEREDIISKKSLEVVKDVILLLKQYSREEGLFRQPGHRLLRDQILNSLKKGEKLEIANNIDTAKACATALHLYLTQMKVPMMPKRVQKLLLAENPGITANVIAHDALGLIRQDVVGRHSELLIDILELLRHLLIFPPPSENTELEGPSLVTKFLPVFFNLEPDEVIKWCQVASRLNELIIEAPKQLSQKSYQSISSEIQNIDQTSHFGMFRDLSLFYPLIQLMENRNMYRIRNTQRNRIRPHQRHRVGRLHPIILRLQT